MSLVIHSASGRADRGDYFCPQSGAIDDHAPSPGPVHRRTECVPASAGPLFPDAQSGRDGQFGPIDLGSLIAGRGGPDGFPCTRSEVRIYSGELDARRDPRAWVAHRRQTQHWALDGATVITRALRYPPGWASGARPGERRRCRPGGWLREAGNRERVRRRPDGDDTRSGDSDELRFRYAIQPDGSDNFAMLSAL